MSDQFAFLAEWPYLAWAVGAATLFYAITAFAISHLHPDKKAHLSLWLQGDYQSTWSAQFCAMFDSVFGENHLRPRCILLSAIASIAAVFALWLLLDPILGLISLRADTGLSLTQALFLGAVINIVPDYISLFETRWLLKQFDRVRNPFGQLAVLVLDAAVSGLIIFAGIALYLLVSGKPQITLIEMMALFSFYAVFFYSTFLTSIWAWAYCLSSWISQITSALRNWLDVRNRPGRILGLVGAAIVLVGSFALKPALTMNEDGRIGVDDFLCSVFPASACPHLARLTKDEKQKLAYLSKACIGGVTERCFETGFKLYQVKPEQAVILFRKSCDGGEAGGCTNLGVMYYKALGVDQDYARALNLYKQGCEGGNAWGCTNLGIMYRKAIGVDQDYARAVDLYKQGCEGGNAGGCTNLGIMYERAFGVDQDYARAVDLYRQGCEGGEAGGCSNLGFMYERALGVDQDYARAIDLYKQGCERGSAWGCSNLGVMYRKNKDYARALDLYKQRCESGNAGGCTNLGVMYLSALGVNKDYARAIDLYKQGCEGGSARGCANLGVMYQNALGIDQDLEKARALYEQACKMKDERACQRLAEIAE